jgi:hypothetical protein
MHSSSKFLSRLTTFTFILFALSLAAAGQADDRSAQNAKQKKPYALLFGTIWGADQRPLTGVRIKIRRVDQKKGKWDLISDSRGEFAQRVPPGKADYLVTAELKHKKGSQPVETKVHVENDERVDFGLHLKQ